MKDNHDIAGRQADWGPLAFLSLQHAGRGIVPDAPSNDERVRAFRSVLPPSQANNYGWRFRQSGFQIAG